MHLCYLNPSISPGKSILNVQCLPTTTYSYLQPVFLPYRRLDTRQQIRIDITAIMATKAGAEAAKALNPAMNPRTVHFWVSQALATSPPSNTNETLRRLPS